MKKMGKKRTKTLDIRPLSECPPDVEVVFEFNNERWQPAHDGYRPHHLVNETYLTTGVHHYYDVTQVPPGGRAKGTITFLLPEAYPASLWIGKKMNIQEGSRIVGHATITKIFNPVLRKVIGDATMEQ